MVEVHYKGSKKVTHIKKANDRGLGRGLTDKQIEGIRQINRLREMVRRRAGFTANARPIVPSQSGLSCVGPRGAAKHKGRLRIGGQRIK